MSVNVCQSLQNQLSAYHDGELSSADAAAVQRHVGRCPRCAAELDAFTRMGDGLRADAAHPSSAGLWQAIEARLDDEHGWSAAEMPAPTAASAPQTARASQGAASEGGWLPASPLVATMAASVLLLVGLGWWSGETPQQHTLSTAASPHADRSHALAHESHGEHEPHDAQFATVMQRYLERFPSDPERAERELFAHYEGRRVDAEAAAHLVGYRPLATGELPEGYSFASTSVLQMPCCTCVKTVCRRSDGTALVLFEHTDVQPDWFGPRPVNRAVCGDKDCCLVQLDSSIAATWEHGSRSVTAVGLRDHQEAENLVRWLGKSS